MLILICYIAHFFIGCIHCFTEIFKGSQVSSTAISIENKIRILKIILSARQLQRTCIFIRKCLWYLCFHRRSLYFSICLYKIDPAFVLGRIPSKSFKRILIYFFITNNGVLILVSILPISYFHQSF